MVVPGTSEPSLGAEAERLGTDFGPPVGPREPHDPELAALVAELSLRWPTLVPELRTGVLALLRGILGAKPDEPQ